jgi:hypothetical protein
MKIKFSYLVIGILVAIIFLQRSCNGEQRSFTPEPIVTTDTIWKTTHDTVYKNVTVLKKEYIKLQGEQYTSGETIDTCKARFQNLLKEHLVRTVYSDTLKLDSLGTIVVRDTVWLNKLYGKREYIKDYKIPFVTKTITKPEPPKRQMYVGGNLFGNSNSMQGVTPGLLYKNKKDQIYQVNVGINFDGTITYGLGAYWKIKLK